jgi:hypothetical protein
MTIISSNLILSYLISKKIISTVQINEIESIKEFFNSSKNKILKIKLKEKVFFVKQFIEKEKGKTNTSFLTEITCYELFEDFSKIFADFDNQIIIYLFQEDYKISNRKINFFNGKSLI